MKTEFLDLSTKRVQPYTLVFLRNGDYVLLMKRNENKDSMPGRWLGLGGKVEHHESILDAAKREFVEESGLTLIDAQIRGSFAWIDETDVIGITHIVVATEFEGSLIKKSREGTLMWHQISDLECLQDLAAYQRLFLTQVLSDSPSFYCGMGVFHKGEIISLARSF